MVYSGREQARTVPGRNCTNHIVTLNLLMFHALLKKAKLYVVFISFAKAYDGVPSYKLIQSLSDLGCGLGVLSAISWCSRICCGDFSTWYEAGAPTSFFFFFFLFHLKYLWIDQNNEANVL